MRCPACEYDVPSGRPACERCGAPLPSAGGPGGSGPADKDGPQTGPMIPQAEPPNPKTEPLSVWDADEERPWNVPPAPPGPGPVQAGSMPPGAMPPWPDSATQKLDAPWGGPVPPGGEPGTQHLGDLWSTGPVPPGQDPAGWNPDLPPAGGAPGADGRTEKNRKTPLLICGIAAVVVLGVGAVWALTQGMSGSKHGTGTPAGQAAAGGSAQQASAANEILKTGSTAHGHLPGRLKTCDDVAAGVSSFQQVVQDRQQELSRSKGLKVDQLRDGTRLRKSMINAYQSSLNADRAYLAWAREIQARNCGSKIAPLTAHYKDAIAANDKAGPAKRQVVNLWKPIASTHGLPTYVWNRL